MPVVLAACSGGLNASNPTAANSPPAADASKASVDGLEVGHRLMAAGEYDLARDAYLRAGAEQGINSDVLSAIGSADLKLGWLNEAEHILRRAVEEDPSFVPALNNLGCVLMERNKFAEAMSVFQKAFALDSGNSEDIRQNLRLAIARTNNTVYAAPVAAEAPRFNLVRRGQGDYVLLSQL